MKAWSVQESFGVENLSLVERDEPELGPQDVRLEMKAMCLNYRDLMMVKGHYNPRQPLPLVPLSDGVGVISEVGDDVEHWKVGDRVCPAFNQSWHAGEPTKSKFAGTLGGPLDGTLRESMVVDAGGLVAVPDYLTDAEAACLPCAAVTAWNALVTYGDVTAGDTILVQGTGGVSIFGLQIGVALGARVIATSSSDEKLEKVREMGAWKTINYQENPDWGRKVRRELTDGGVDHVVEIGGAGTLEQSLEAVRIGGQISVIGVLGGVKEELSVIPILMKGVRLQGIFVGHRESFEAMNRAFEAHEIRPQISDRFAFDEAVGAFELMQRSGHFSKIVIEV